MKNIEKEKDNQKIEDLTLEYMKKKKEKLMLFGK